MNLFSESLKTIQPCIWPSYTNYKHCKLLYGNWQEGVQVLHCPGKDTGKLFFKIWDYLFLEIQITTTIAYCGKLFERNPQKDYWFNSHYCIRPIHSGVTYEIAMTLNNPAFQVLIFLQTSGNQTIFIITYLWKNLLNRYFSAIIPK